MKCDRCDNESTVHEVLIRNGKRHERHLCEACAKGEGLPVQSAAPITQLLTQYITSQVQSAGSGGLAKVIAGAAANACPECGLSFNQFRQTGLLGCPECYAAFEGQLSPLLARAHDRGTHHKGKTPPALRPNPSPRTAAPVSPPPTSAELAAKAGELRNRLSEAVAAEQYELAAQLRDELLKLEAAPAAKPRKTATKRTTKPPRDTGEEPA